MNTSLQQRRSHRVRGLMSWLRRLALGLVVFVALLSLAFIVVSMVFAEEIKETFGAPAGCVCGASEKRVKTPAPAVDLRM
jgi:hypothetical protein